MDQIKQLWARLQKTRPLRAWKQFGDNNGNLLAAGVAYFSFFSVFPAIALAFTVFGFVLQDRPELLDTIAASLNQFLPGMIKTAATPNGIISLSTPQAAALTVTGIASLATLLWAGLGWIGSLRSAIRSIFGVEPSLGSFLSDKTRDFITLITLGFGIAVSAVLSSAIGGAAGVVAERIGLGGSTWVVTLGGFVISLFFDAVLVAILIRLCSGVDLPWPRVRAGALFGGVLLTLVKMFGSMLIAAATRNPLLAAVAVAVGLLFILNLIAKIVLLSAAWAANDYSLAAENPEVARAVAVRDELTARDEGLAEAIVTGTVGPQDAQQRQALGMPPLEDGSPETQRVSRSAAEVRAEVRSNVAVGAVAGAGLASLVGAVRRRRKLKS